MLFKALLILVVLLIPIRVLGGVGYGGYHEIAVSGYDGSFKHIHDYWNWDGRKQRLALIQGPPSKFFSEENNFSYVEYIDRAGKMLFRSPSPAFTKLWIDPFGEFVVGLSNIRFHNPYQLVVWRRDGTLVHRQSISSSVIRMNEDEKREFETLFPETADELADKYFTYEGTTFLNFSYVRSFQSDRYAHEYLEARKEPHPYGVKGIDSNHVYWFPECLELKIENRRSKVPILTMKKSDGKVISVELKGVKN